MAALITTAAWTATMATIAIGMGPLLAAAMAAVAAVRSATTKRQTSLVLIRELESMVVLLLKK